MPASFRLLTVLAAIAFSLPAAATETAPMAAQPAAAATDVAAAATAAPAAPTEQGTQPVDSSAAKPGAGQAAPATKVPAGYKSKVVKGETLFCRKTTPLGSRFPTEFCMTAAQYEESVQQSDGLRQELTGKQKSYAINN